MVIGVTVWKVRVWLEDRKVRVVLKVREFTVEVEGRKVRVVFEVRGVTVKVRGVRMTA